MKHLKFTTNGNCQGKYDEEVLASGNVGTAIGFKRLYNKALTAFQEYKRHSPNYPFLLFSDDEQIADFELGCLVLAASDDKELSDDVTIQKFLNK